VSISFRLANVNSCHFTRLVNCSLKGALLASLILLAAILVIAQPSASNQAFILAKSSCTVAASSLNHFCNSNNSHLQAASLSSFSSSSLVFFQEILSATFFLSVIHSSDTSSSSSTISSVTPHVGVVIPHVGVTSSTTVVSVSVILGVVHFFNTTQPFVLTSQVVGSVIVSKAQVSFHKEPTQAFFVILDLICFKASSLLTPVFHSLVTSAFSHHLNCSAKVLSVANFFFNFAALVAIIN